MQHVHTIKCIFIITLIIILVALTIDQYLSPYLPTIKPIQSIKYYLNRTTKSKSNIILNIIVQFVQCYALWIILWFAQHYFLCTDFISSIKCTSGRNNQHNDQLQQQNGMKLYQALSNSEQQHTTYNQPIIQTTKLTTPLQQQQSKASTITTPFKLFIYPYAITFLVIFTIFFLTILFIEFQISLISSELKNGSQSSMWMGTREYYTLDFFHNIPQQFKGNHKLMDLFDTQDKSVSMINNWIANYRLFFGLFYLMLKSLSPFIFFIFFVLMFFSYKIDLNERKKSSNKHFITVGYKLKSIIKHSSQFSLFNLTFLLFLGFSILSALFLQLKTKNNLQLCSVIQQPKGGFYLALNKSVETQIISELMAVYHSLALNTDNPHHQLSRHQILFVFQSMCQIFSPFYTKVINLQQIFLFSMRLGELFFGFTLLLMVYVKFKQRQITQKSI